VGFLGGFFGVFLGGFFKKKLSTLPTLCLDLSTTLLHGGLDSTRQVTRVTYAGAADNIGQVQQLLLALTPQRAIPAHGACVIETSDFDKIS
jgi:hypothetical protein